MRVFSFASFVGGSLRERAFSASSSRVYVVRKIFENSCCGSYSVLLVRLRVRISVCLCVYVYYKICVYFMNRITFHLRNANRVVTDSRCRGGTVDIRDG